MRLLLLPRLRLRLLHLLRELRQGDDDRQLLLARVRLPSNYSLFIPLLYQVATGELPPHAIAHPRRADGVAFQREPGGRGVEPAPAARP
jgi:hypothetical protein